MKTRHTPHHLAVLNELNLKAFQTPNRPINPLSPPDQGFVPSDSSDPTASGANQPSRRVVELTVGVNPRDLLEQVLAGVASWPLREFLGEVLAEPEVELALTTPIPASSSSTRQSLQSYPVQRLRRAAEMAGYWCAFGRDERSVLYVATLVRGIGELLAGYVVGGANLDDILFTLVRPALHRLDDGEPRQACLLRLCLGWGNADEVDACYVPRLQKSVAQALRAVQIGPATQHPSRLC